MMNTAENCIVQNKKMKVTQQPIHTYDELQTAFDFFNQRLFDSKLPNCLITLQRKKTTVGYYSPKRFISKTGEECDEIAMNPEFFSIEPIEYHLSTLAHEMCHQWQHHFGKTSRKGYHNKQWANKMISIGLMPSHNGQQGGKITGQKMSDYIIEGGVFEHCCKELITDGFKLTWADKYPPFTQLSVLSNNGTKPINSSDNQTLTPAKKPQTRVKYSCNSCQANLWGKPGMNVICGECNIKFTQVEG